MANRNEVTTSRFTVNPDLQSERDTSTINSLEITNFIDGGKEKTERRRQIENILFSDPAFHIRKDIFLSKQEQYAANMRRSVKLLQMQREGKWVDDEFDMIMRILHHTFSFSLHHSMFIPALERLGSEEQKAKWLPLARAYQIIGTYAQTEVGHGTYLMELETTATYEPSTEEFIMNTPKQSSMKWWPGNLGKTANFAIVLAQLVINGTRYGMHPFVVQLRSLDDHTLRLGVKAGDIGPKMGGNSYDNGYLILNNVRIPRNNMLMKNAQVTPSGKFVTSGPSKANYATMVYVRVQITLWCCGVMALATISSIRYSAVRRQSTLQPGAPENKILDYQTQQYKLFPGLTVAYCSFLAHKVLLVRYNTMLVEINNGSYKSLPELHAISSGLKAILSDLTTKNIEIMRRSCGGHGYLKASGMSEAVVDSLPLVTVEGENTVLYLQVARYLLKQLAKTLSGQLCTGSTEYLNMNPSAYTCPIQTPNDCRNVQHLCQLYKKRAYSVLFEVAQKLQGDMEKGTEQHIAMNNNLQALVRAATAHCYVLALSGFIDGMDATPLSSPTRKAVYNLCNLFAIHHLVTESGDFLESDAIGLEQLQWLRQQEMALLAEIRPEAVGLCDAFDFHDETLGSAIGCWDGRAYERLYESTLLEPMNQQEVDPAYHKYQSQLKNQGTKSRL